MGPIPYGRQHITEEDIAEVVRVLKADYLTQGPEIAAFERDFAAYVGAPQAVAVSNGTAALHLCAMAMGVKQGERVITSPITFAASANCVRYQGAEVLFADIDPETTLLDIDSVRSLLESDTDGRIKGIIPVDFAGYPVNLQAYRKLADEFGCWLIEDACHAPGGYFTDDQGIRQHCGNGAYAEAAIFSFHPVKHIASGEGGMVTTANSDVAERIARLRTHGITKDAELLRQNDGGWYYEMHELGYNYRITDFQSVLGRSQLKRAAEGLARRRTLAAAYDRAFEGSRVRFIRPDDGVGHAYHLYVVRVDNRKELYDRLREKQIYAQVHYIPVHQLPYYSDQTKGKADLPQAETYYSECLSLPMYPTLTDAEQSFVIEQVLQISG